MLTGERIWQQPIEDSYFKDNVKSSIADLKNYPGSSAPLDCAFRLLKLTARTWSAATPCCLCCALIV